jgi:hypothetical protein
VQPLPAVAEDASAFPDLIDPARLRLPESLLRHDAFPFLVARDQLPDRARSDLHEDFPRYAGAGYFPYADADCGPAVRQLVTGLTSAAFADAIGDALGIDKLSGYPTLVTLCRSLNKRHGTIHTDSQSKVASVLLYLNESWPDTSDGCLRLLRRIDDIDDLLVPEVRPLYGNLVAFKRADNSFHGHLPFEGERRVIQVAWLASEAEKLRKTRRGRASRFLKWLLGKFDRQHGADRGRNAFHK